MKIVPSEQPQHTATMVPAAYCADCWPAVRGYLQPAVDLAHGRWTLPHILSALVLGQQSLWIIRDQQDSIVGALTVGVTRYPAKTMLTIHFLGGDGMNDWYDVMSNAMTDYARHRHCEGIECSARGGFWKWFKDDGFEKTAVFYEKKV